MSIVTQPKERLEPNVPNVFNVIKERSERMLNVANNLEIRSDETLNLGTNLWKEAKNLGKKVEEHRKQTIEPLRNVISNVNDKAKEISEPLKNVENVIKRKVETYQQTLNEAALMIDTFEPNVPNVRTSDAITYTKVQKRFKIVDKTLIPLHYLCVDEEKVELAIKAGLMIPGIEIYEEQKMIMRSR